MFSRDFIPVYKIQKFGLRTSAESHNNVFKKVFTNLDKYRKNLIKNDHALHECFKYITKLKTKEKKFSYIDVGCGGGNLAFMLYKHLTKVNAFDISDYIIKKNKQKNNKINFFVDNIVKSKKRKKYSVISMCGVLYAIDEKPETHLKVFKNLKQMMKKNSILIFYHRLNLSFLNYLDIKLNKNDQKKEGESYRMTYFKNKYIKYLCKKNGLKIIQTTQIDHKFNLYNTFISKFCIKKNKNINLFGKLLVFISTHIYQNLISRSSMFIIKKN